MPEQPRPRYRNDRVADLAVLGAGWDSYGAPPIDPRALETADALWIVATCRAGIGIELHAGGFDIEIDILADGTVESVNVARAQEAGRG
jgi:hypothetical protein